MLPEMRRPRGPRNERATLDTKPKVARLPLPLVVTANAAVPIVAARCDHSTCRRRPRVNAEHGEIAVHVDAGEGSVCLSAIGEGHRC